MRQKPIFKNGKKFNAADFELIKLLLSRDKRLGGVKRAANYTGWSTAQVSIVKNLPDFAAYEQYKAQEAAKRNKLPQDVKARVENGVKVSYAVMQNENELLAGVLRQSLKTNELLEQLLEVWKK